MAMMLTSPISMVASPLAGTRSYSWTLKEWRYAASGSVSRDTAERTAPSAKPVERNSPTRKLHWPPMELMAQLPASMEHHITRLAFPWQSEQKRSSSAPTTPNKRIWKSR